jgi:threonine dehydrogenase-like Zn-dependent dehydrogenase
MIAEGLIQPDMLVTHHFHLDRVQEAFELVADYRDGVIKAMLDLSSAD